MILKIQITYYVLCHRKIKTRKCRVLILVIMKWTELNILNFYLKCFRHVLLKNVLKNFNQCKKMNLVHLHQLKTKEVLNIIHEVRKEQDKHFLRKKNNQLKLKLKLNLVKVIQVMNQKLRHLNKPENC